MLLLVLSVNKAITRSQRARQRVERARGIRAGSPDGDKTTGNLLENSQQNGAKSTEELGNAKTANRNAIKIKGFKSCINAAGGIHPHSQPLHKLQPKCGKTSTETVIEISVKLSFFATEAPVFNPLHRSSMRDVPECSNLPSPAAVGLDIKNPNTFEHRLGGGAEGACDVR